MYFLLCISLMLAALLGVNVVLSVVAGLVWRVGRRHFETLAPATRARLVFFLSAAPFAAAFLLIAGVLLPAYLMFEPADASERVGVGLMFAALVSLAGVAVAAYRVFSSWWATHRLVGRWNREGELITLPGVAIPVVLIEHPFPVVAVAGAIRSRMYVAAQVLEFLSADERDAAVRHELGHLAARDNLKRVIMRISRDVLIFPFGKPLESAWNEATEESADEFAARDGASAALDIAAALVKIARGVPVGGSPEMIPDGAFLVSGDGDFISRRIERLVSMAGAEAETPAMNSRLSDLRPILVFSAALAVFLIYADVKLLHYVHDMTERVVAALQ